MTDEPEWMAWAWKLQAIAQAGLAYSENPYDQQRYREIRELSVEIIHTHTDTDLTRIHDLLASETGYSTPEVDSKRILKPLNPVFFSDRTSPSVDGQEYERADRDVLRGTKEEISRAPF